MDPYVSNRDFPILAGIFFGLGLGGFFDGIVLHHILQWHHMLTSAGYPATTLDNLQFNIVWGRSLPRQHICVRGNRPHHPLAYRAQAACCHRVR